MSKKPESRLQQKIHSALAAEFGGYWTKIHTGPFQHRGFPDLLGCINGQFIALEVKMPGERSTEIQSAVQREIKRHGGISGEVHSVEEALHAIREARTKTKRSG